MRILSVVLFSLLFLSACNQQYMHDKQQIDDSFIGFKANQNTITESIQTIESPNISKLIDQLKIDLAKDKFKIEVLDNKLSQTYSNCEENKIIKFEGAGMKSFYIKREEAKPKNYYPDFMLYIYALADESKAEAIDTEISKALQTDNGFCNGKSKLIVHHNKNLLIVLGTRADMFMNYIYTYGTFAKDYPLD
jgi:hypothetical protein